MNHATPVKDVVIEMNGGAGFGQLAFDRFVADHKLEQYILNTKWEDVPEDVKKRAIVCSIDLMMALVLGSRGMQHAAGLKLNDMVCSEGDVPIVGSQKTFNFMGAVIAMGHASNSFDIDDGHNLIRTHPGTSFIAGLMAAALEKNVTYKEYLTTLVVCYETAIRAAFAMQKYYGFFHGTGSYGAVGTAVAIGRLFGLTEDELSNAISIADFHAPMVPGVHGVPKPCMNKDGVPFGAMAGAIAVLETLAGYTGNGYLLDIPFIHELVASLGEDYEMLNLYFKPYTCCRHIHPTIQAIADLKQRYGFTSDDIEKVQVHTYRSACELARHAPKRTDEAQYNIAYPTACALVHGDVGFEQVREEALGDRKVLAMMDRLEFIIDPVFDSEFPQKRQAKVVIALNDGQILTSEVTEAAGEAKDHVDLAWITEKFNRITKPMFTAEKQAQILAVLSEASDMPMREIVDMVNQSYLF